MKRLCTIKPELCRHLILTITEMTNKATYLYIFPSGSKLCFYFSNKVINVNFNPVSSTVKYWSIKHRMNFFLSPILFSPSLPPTYPVPFHPWPATFSCSLLILFPHTVSLGSCSQSLYSSFPPCFTPTLII